MTNSVAKGERSFGETGQFQLDSVVPPKDYHFLFRTDDIEREIAERNRFASQVEQLPAEGLDEATRKPGCSRPKSELVTDHFQRPYSVASKTPMPFAWR